MFLGLERTLVSLFSAASILAAAPSHADVAEVVDDVILPSVAAFSERATSLAAATSDCTRVAVLPAYAAARDAWSAIADLRLGPSEAANLTIAFWPDERGNGARTLTTIIASGNRGILEPKAFADVSAAARGLAALDLLLGDAAFVDDTTGFVCALVRTVADDLAAQARALKAGWADHAALLREPGRGGNVAYLDVTEARRAIYTQILSGLSFTIDSRLGRPLGTFERPRPGRAESWRTGRSLASALGAARAAHALADALSDRPLPATDAAMALVEAAAAAVRDPGFRDIAHPAARLRVEILQQRIAALKDAIEAELGAGQGLSGGFNAQDGD